MAISKLLREITGRILLESGSRILLEGSVAVPLVLSGELVDVALTADALGNYDISFNSDGDFTGIQNFDTAVLMSILTDKRADSSEVIQPELRRGWWGNTENAVEGYEIGSKAWLLSQARKTQDNLNLLLDYISDGLQWMVDDGYCQKIDVTGELDTEGYTISIKFVQEDNKVDNPHYQYWQEATT